MSRSVRVFTTGGGGSPFSRPNRYAAAAPISSAPGPQASTAAMYVASTLGATWPTR